MNKTPTVSHSIKFYFLALLGVLLALMTVRVQAHGYIVRAIPEDRAVLERAPARVQYWFSEDLEPQFSQISLIDQTGNVIATGGVDEDDQSLMALRPPADLPDGAYVVSLRPAFASDGHVVGETRVFFVGEAVGGVTGEAASDQPVPLEIVWRAIVLSASSLLFGVYVVYVRVLIPAWGNKKYIAGFLPPRVITRLYWIAGAAFVVALLGNTLALVQNAMVLFNQSAANVISANLWNTARISSRFGDVWNWRMLIFVAIGAAYGLSLFWRNSKPRTIAPFWHMQMWGAGLVLATFAVSSHASGSLVMAWVAMLMHWLHMTAVALWVGGLAALTLVLPVALQPYEGEQRRLALLAAMRKFSTLALGAAVVTVVTGVYNSLNWLYTPVEVTTTSYGLALVVKVALVVGLLAVGAVHHIAAHPDRFTRWSQRTSGWRFTLPLESVLALVVLTAAGWVSATPPPTPDFLQNEIAAPRAVQTADGLTVDMMLSPGGLGVNTYDTRLSRDAQAITDADVYVRMVKPDDDWRGEWHKAEAIDEGLYVSAGDEFDTEGAWVALVDVVEGDSITRLAFAWDITDAASVLQSIPPRPQHWGALGMVLLALGWVSYGDYQRFMRLMNWSAVTGAVLILATLGTAGAIWWGFDYLGRVQAENDALLNPPPRIVNDVLPDADSLQRGETVFVDACGWPSDDSTVAALIERLPRTRDDELFDAVADGWRGLPACAVDDDATRWDVVNYLRTWEAR